MPEIYTKRATKSRSKKKPTQAKTKQAKKNLKNQKKHPISGDSINWGSSQTKKKEPRVTPYQCYFIIGAIIFLFLFSLWAFVPDRQTLKTRAADKRAAYLKKERDAAKNLADLNRKVRGFEHAQLLNSSEFSVVLKNMHEGDFYDRIMLVAFDDSTRDAEANPLKVKMFKKCESLAKSLPRKSVFKRYEDEDLPLIILFDCGNPNDPAAEQLCSKIIGKNIPNQLIFRSKQQPRQLPNEHKSQNQIIQYLFNLMQPAVKYLEDLADAEHFVANDAHLNVVYFSSMIASLNNLPQKTFENIADSLRDYARFGRAKNPTIIDAFDIDIKDLPSILIWRTFGAENPKVFSGNMSYAENINEFVMNNYVPMFAEFTPKTSGAYMKRGLPILWIAYNVDDESINLKELFEVSENMAHRFLGRLTFTQLDVKGQPQIASNFGLDINKATSDDNEDENENESNNPELPQAFIMNQIAQLHETIDMDDIQGSIEKVVEAYMKALRVHNGGNDLSELNEYNNGEVDDEEDEFIEDDDDGVDEEEEDEVDLAQLDDVEGVTVNDGQKDETIVDKSEL